MIERIHSFQLLSRYHAIIEAIREDPRPRLVLISRVVDGAEGREQGVGIFPSSFNPVTTGHLAVVQRAAEVKVLGEVLLVLDTQALDKESFGATLVDRLLMLQVLFGDHPRFSVGVTNRGLFLAKAEALREAYPRGTDITFIVGFDTLARVFDPRYYEEPREALNRLFACCTFMVANRGGYGREDVQQLISSAEGGRFRDKVCFFEIPHRLAEISSSRVRQRVNEGKPFARFVPPQVREFIEGVKLYRPDSAVGPQGQSINLYGLRTHVLRLLYALYPDGMVEINIGEIVDKVVAGMTKGGDPEALLEGITNCLAMRHGSDGRKRYHS